MGFQSFLFNEDKNRCLLFVLFVVYFRQLYGKQEQLEEEMNRLKEREQKILDFMKSEIKTKGYPPTVREICTALGIKSTSTVHKDIASLVDQGFLKKDPSKPRALMVVDTEDHAAASAGAGKTMSINVSELDTATISEFTTFGDFTVSANTDKKSVSGYANMLKKD